jgi:hypothetical protein
MLIRKPEHEHHLGGPLPAIPLPTLPLPPSWISKMPSLQKWSLDALKLPLGTLIRDVVDGYPVVAQIQTHYAFGAHPDWPERPHRGTSVFALASPDASGRLVAVRDPPEGWLNETDTLSGESPMGFDAHKEWQTYGNPVLRTIRKWALPAVGTAAGAVFGGGLLWTLGGLAAGVGAKSYLETGSVHPPMLRRPLPFLRRRA